ncbi:hypothetical protein BSM4216_1562 [Bacillus smithii]|nr:hypothetical protein BSM4216_1562 [Bacillus smithii]
MEKIQLLPKKLRLYSLTGRLKRKGVTPQISLRKVIFRKIKCQFP